jgi:hypothetical protein
MSISYRNRNAPCQLGFSKVFFWIGTPYVRKNIVRSVVHLDRFRHLIIPLDSPVSDRIRVLLLGPLQPRFQQIDLSLRRPNSRFRLLLKRVQNVYDACESNRIYRAKRVSAMVGKDLQYAGTAKALERLRVWMFATLLGDVQSVPY